MEIFLIRISIQYGKHWIRSYSLSLCKQTLGFVRSKFSTIPIPGETITLNGEALLSEAKSEMERLKTEIKEILEQTSYLEMSKTTKEIMDMTNDTLKNIPLGVYKRVKNMIYFLEQFIGKAKEVHKNKYDYSEFVYVSAKTKGKIICPIHR